MIGYSHHVWNYVFFLDFCVEKQRLSFIFLFVLHGDMADPGFTSSRDSVCWCDYVSLCLTSCLSSPQFVPDLLSLLSTVEAEARGGQPHLPPHRLEVRLADGQNLRKERRLRRA